MGLDTTFYPSGVSIDCMSMCKSFNCASPVNDSFPVPACRFARAYRCKRLRIWAAWGYDEATKHKFLGLRAHVHICWPGVIVRFALHPASMHDLCVAQDLLPPTED